MYNLNYLEIIDSIIPPRDWTDHNSKLHIQYVSHQPATRDDVNELTATLDQMLLDRQAKKNGICAIR
jgi:dynein light intermediate chain